MDTSKKMQFRFGNGQTQKSLGTGTLKVPSLGEMRVNIIDTQQYVPTLCSIQWLKHSGATIDFGTSEMMMSDGRVIILERAASGHLLMDVINKNQELRPEEIQSQILRAAKETRTSTRTKTGRRYEAYLGEAEREAPEVG